MKIGLSINIVIKSLLDCYSPIGPGSPAAGSQAGPGPGPDRLGLKCYWLGGEPGWWGGGERGNFMYLNHNFAFMT